MGKDFALMSDADLRSAILGAPDLNQCLQIFRELLGRISNAEICFINLHDREHNVLRCVEVILPEAMAHFRDSYINFAFPSDSDNFRVLESGQSLEITQECKHLHSASTRLVFEFWKARSIIFLPIAADAEGAACVGTLALVMIEQAVTAETVRRINAWVHESAMLLHLHMNMRVYGEQAQTLHSLETELSSMLKFVAETSNLASIDEICERVLGEFVSRFDHQLGAIWLREDDELRCVATYAGNVQALWIKGWLEYCDKSRLSALDPQDSATSYIFITGRPMLFGDIPATRKLNIPDKDATLLDATDGLQSFSMHPIRQFGKAIGVLGLFHLRQKHALTPPQMEQIGYWADFLGAVLESARTYDALDARSAELSSRNAELDAALMSLHQAQAALIQSKKLSALGAIVTAVAHELNTPIGNALTISTAVGDDAEYIEQELARGLRRSTLDSFIRKIQEASQMIHRNLDRASQLIDRFKEIAVDRKSAHRQQFYVGTVLQEAIEVCQAKWHEAQVEVSFLTDSNCLCDTYAGALSQTVLSLVENAITHAFDACSNGRVSISLHEIDAGNICIKVIDNGVGIVPENLERIFDPFFTTRLGKGSSGLGLYVVYNVVTTVLDGAIEVESTVGQGTCFTLTLPRVAKLEAADHR